MRASFKFILQQKSGTGNLKRTQEISPPLLQLIHQPKSKGSLSNQLRPPLIIETSDSVQASPANKDQEN